MASKIDEASRHLVTEAIAMSSAVALSAISREVADEISNTYNRLGDAAIGYVSALLSFISTQESTTVENKKAIERVVPILTAMIRVSN